MSGDLTKVLVPLKTVERGCSVSDLPHLRHFSVVEIKSGLIRFYDPPFRGIGITALTVFK